MECLKQLAPNELGNSILTIRAGFELVEKKRQQMSQLGALSIGKKIEAAEEISKLCLAMSRESWDITLHTLKKLEEQDEQLLALEKKVYQLIDQGAVVDG